jgi:two-component system, LuxR family, response regulator DctR
MTALPGTPRVIIVDDEQAVRESICYLLASHGLVTLDFSSGPALLAAFDQVWRGCILCDVRMPAMSGLEVFEALKCRGSRLPLILLTGHGDVPMAVSALKSGVRDFLEKPFNAEDLVTRLRSAFEADRLAQAAYAAHRGIEARLGQLSQRERDVLTLLCAGLQNKVIADDLGIAMRTVEVHRARVFEKMGVQNAIELATLMSSHQRGAG